MRRSASPGHDSTRRTSANVALLIVVILGLAVNFFVGLGLGQNKLFYPIDPMRGYMDVALSRLRGAPIFGYAAFSSIDRYLQESGFSYDHSQTEIRKLLGDSARVEDIWREALSMKMDSDRPDISITGDNAYADFISGSLALFGMHPGSLYLFYFFLLSTSVALFLICFWRSASGLWVLGTYLAAHLLIVIYVSDEIPFIESIANQRALTTFAVLPALHLVLLSATRGRITVAAAIASCAQCIILGFVVCCRFDSVVLALVGVGALALSTLLAFRRKENARHDRRAKLLLFLSSLVILGGMQIRQTWTVRNVDPHGGHHVIWWVVLSSLLRDDPTLFEENTGIPKNQEILFDSDQIPCLAIVKYYREKVGNSFSADCERVPPEKIASQYEQLGFELFIKMLRKHPWLPLVFLRDSPRQQLDIWTANRSLSFRYGYPAVLLAMTVLLTFVASRGRLTVDFKPTMLFGGMVLLTLASLIDPLIFPSLNQTGTLTLLVFDLALLGFAIVWTSSSFLGFNRASGSGTPGWINFSG
jgi:hypothetical protein